MPEVAGMVLSVVSVRAVPAEVTVDVPAGAGQL